MSTEIATTPATGGALAPADVVKIPEATLEKFPALDPESEILELLAENLAEGENLGIGNLTKVGNPSGDTLTFKLPSADGGRPETVDSIEGIVLNWQDGRTYYESEQATEGAPPDCSSRDAVHGFGEFMKGSAANPTGLCADCPMGQWVRSTNGGPDTPPACKEMVNVLVLTDREALPLLVRVPRTSKSDFEKYRKGLVRYNTGLARSITKITLDSAKSTDNVKYAKMTFGLGDKLPGNKLEVKATAAAVLAFGAQMKSIITAAPARETAAISATAERTTIENEGGASFGPVDEPTDAEIADAFDGGVADEAETSSAAAS